jgi:hypothetical protein
LVFDQLDVARRSADAHLLGHANIQVRNPILVPWDRCCWCGIDEVG